MLDELNKTRLNNVYSRCCLLPHAAVLLKCTYVATHIHKHTNTQTHKQLMQKAWLPFLACNLLMLHPLILPPPVQHVKVAVSDGAVEEKVSEIS